MGVYCAKNKYILTIIVPTTSLNELLEDRLNTFFSFKENKIINLIITSSDCENIKNFIEENYGIMSNLTFVKASLNSSIEDKIKSTVNLVKTEFVYICGNGILPNFQRLISLLKECDYDVMILLPNNSFGKRYKKCKTVEERKFSLFYFLTFIGGSIIKINLIKNIVEIKQNINFLYPVTIMNNLDEKSRITYCVGPFYQANAKKKKSTWENAHDLLNVWCIDYCKSIFLLDSRFDDLKPFLLKANFDGVFTFRKLLHYKVSGIFDLKLFKKYIGWYKLEGNCTLKLYLTYFTPIFLLRFLKSLKSFLKL